MELELDCIKKQFKNKIAVDRVSFRMRPGIYGLLGANGAGKTTLMRMMAGILRPDEGRIHLDGIDVSEEAYRDKLGYLPQEFGYYPNFKTEDFMMYLASLKGLTKTRARAVTRELLELVGLSDVSEKKIKTFSGGMKQRLGIAQAMLNNPRLLILDEPTAGLDAVIDEDAADFLADTANGDARAALNAVELGVLTTERAGDGKIHINLSVAQECIQKRVVRYDKNGDNHYDTVSAFIKSMRGSDPDAAVYYLARMLYAGEDIKFIARRIMICASEDVGNADPQALAVAVNAAQAVERIGLPEAQIILSQAVTYVATAPKSNAACMAVFKAMDAVRDQRTMPVPVHLQDRHYKGAEKLGHGAGYKYAHDYPKHYVKQQYLPDGMEGAVFYEPSDNGYEASIKTHMNWLTN